jgi:hypothetical protein
MSDRIPEPKEAMRFLSRKIKVPTDRWDDLKWGEHAHAFTVAHSTEADVLNDIHGLLNKAVASGEAFGTFKKGMLAAMEKSGWYGGDGHGKDEKKYINWRIRIMYDTNMRTAFSAAHYRKQLDGAELRPVWVYVSKLVGDNRRQEHIALHGKAFRYDDSFWDTYYPPNGWGCECSVTTKSESGAERDGVDVLESNADGNPPALTDKDGNAIDWRTFGDPTWKFNVGKEALAPNFQKYKNLADIRMDDGRTALRHVIDRYRDDMDETRLSQGQFKMLVDRMGKGEYEYRDILYQVGNLDVARHEAMMKAGLGDSKVMASDRRIQHGTIDKNNAQRVPETLYGDLYQMLQMPEGIYEERSPERPRNGRAFHFVKDTKDGKTLMAILRCLGGTALRVVTMGWATYEYPEGMYKKIW